MRIVKFLVLLTVLLGVLFILPVIAADNLIVIDMSLYPESDHSYASGLDEAKTFTYPEALELTVTFSPLTEVEAGYDFLYLYDELGNDLARYTGKEAAGVSVTIPGNTFIIRLVSDGSGQAYGYAFSSIQAAVSVEQFGGVAAPDCKHTQTADGFCLGCGCEISVIIIAEDDTVLANFISLSDGLDAAVAGQQLVLQKDCSIDSVVLPSGVSLELNGYSLATDFLFSYESCAVTDTSVSGSGLLIFTEENGNAISKDNPQLPVYDRESGGYRFFSVDVETCAVTDGNKYWFRVNAENFSGMYSLISEGADVQLCAKLIWDGQTSEVYAKANTSFIMEWAEEYKENDAVYITVSTTEDAGLENFRLIPLIASVGVEICGEEMKYIG